MRVEGFGFLVFFFVFLPEFFWTSTPDLISGSDLGNPSEILFPGLSE